ncbi:MAG: PBSX family phage terminase large subunit [Terriglobales bacterium]
MSAECQQDRENATNSTVTSLELPSWAECLFRRSRYKVAHGGRGSSKSWSFAKALILRAAEKRLRILCCRELMNSISESVHHLLADQIRAMRLGHKFEVQQQAILGVNGSEFIFAGLATNPEKIRSTEGVDIAWVEEGEHISERSWEILVPTIRQEDSEIWVSMNPDLVSDPSYERFVLNPPPNSIVKKVNWQENPWLPEVLRQEKDYLYRVDPEAADYVWGGNPRTNLSAQIFHGKYIVSEFEPRDGWAGPYYGADWGFAADPTVLMRCWIDGRRLLVDGEAYGFGVELDRVPGLFEQVPRSREYLIRADNSRPETIAHIKSRGFRIEGASKWDGSIEDGIGFLRSFEQIVIHPRCTHLQDEARLYSYKRDRLSGDVLPDIVDKHNHCWDSIRYALEPIVRRSRMAVYGHSESQITFGDAELDARPPLLQNYLSCFIGVEASTARVVVFVEAIDDSEVCWVLREFYWDAAQQGRQSDVAADLLKFIAGSRAKSTPCVLVKESAGGLRERLFNEGLWVRDQEEDDEVVASGIRTVDLAFGRKSLKVHTSCTNLLRDLQLYRWDADKQARGVEQAEKKNSFSCDALRRIAAEVFQPWRMTS